MLSFIITTFNYQNYILECIDSIINQSLFKDSKIILIDDGSTDNTKSLIKKYLDLSYFKYIRIDNCGIEKASNLGIDNVNTEYFVRVDADDKLKNNFIQKCFPIIKENKADFLYSNYNQIDKQSALIKEISLPSYDPKEIFERGDFLATGTIYRTDFVKSIGKYSESVPNCGLENYSLILKIILAGGKGRHIKDVLFEYRIHEKSLSQEKKDKIIEYGHNLTKQLLNKPYVTNINHPQSLVI